MPAVEFKVYDRASGSYLTSLQRAEDRQCQDVENDTGTGGVTLPLGDSDLAHMKEGNIVRCYVDGVAAFSWVVGPMDQSTVAADEEAGEERRISGRGTLGLWADAIVYPETRATSIGYVWPPLEERRVVDVRRFDFAAVGYDDAAWAPAVVVPPPPALAPLNGTPAGWPLESQDWIWSRAVDANGNHPPGHSYFRHAFSAASPTKASIFITADNGFELFLDGELLLSEMRTPLLWPTSRSVQVELTAATHFISVKAVNHDVPTAPFNPAGVAMVVVAMDNNGDPASVLTSTGAAGWKCSDYPAEPPGETVGMIVYKLWQEAQIRGALLDLTLGFSTTHDSAGVAWPNAPDVALSVGDDYLQVLRKLSELYCDFSMDPASLRLDAWVTRGTNRSGSVSFAIGTNITALSHKGGEQARTSAILGRFGDHWLETTGSGRRQEKFLEMGSATSSAQAERMISAALAERELPIITTTTGWEPTAGTVPWVHFRCGDQVSVPNATGAMVSGRVKSISLNETEDDYDFVAEIGSVNSDILDRLQKMARKSGHGALDANFANATASNGSGAMADVHGSQFTSAIPDIPLNSLTDVMSVPSAPLISGDFLGWNPDLGTNGMWEPMGLPPSGDVVGTGVDGTFLVSDSTAASGRRWTFEGELSIDSLDNLRVGGAITAGSSIYAGTDLSVNLTLSASEALIKGGNTLAQYYYPARLGVPPGTGFSRSLAITGPVEADGWGRATCELIGINDGTAKANVYNDLDVNGAYLVTSADAKYMLLEVLFGDMKAQNYLPSSDPDLKSDIRAAGPALPILRKVPQRKQWKWKAGRQEEASGFTADDIASTVPELAYFDSDGKPTAWKMVDAVALLLSGVQELTARLEALEAK